MYGLYITVHDDGLIHLWGISPSKMKHLYTLSLISDWAFPYKPQTRMAFIQENSLIGKATALDMNISTRTLAVGYDFGSIALWHYINSVFMNFHNIALNTSQIT